MKKPFKPQKVNKPVVPAKTAPNVAAKANESAALKRPPVSPTPAKSVGNSEKPVPASASANKPASGKPSSGSTGMKPISPRRLVTTITAIIDVGFGNMLYLRGEGPGLSWDKGVPLECADANRWTLTVGESSRPVVCKFLINDSEWNKGEDYTVAPGTSITITPVF